MERKLKLLSILELLEDFEFDYVNALNYEIITIYLPGENYLFLSYSKTEDIFYIDVDEGERVQISFDELVELAREHRLKEMNLVRRNFNV